jgi:RHS repeat-associated protein
MTYEATYAGATIFRQEFTRDAAGRIGTKTETVDGVTTIYGYSYDMAGRLTEVTTNGTLTSSYSFDANGNRLTRTTTSGTETGTYDDQDRMLTYGGATYSYTDNGDLKTKTDTSGTTTYEYDALSNLRRVDLPDGRVIEYVIDGQNRRVGKKVDGVLERAWIYDGQLTPIAELDGSGTVISRFEGGTMMRGGVTYRVISDHLGSPRVIVDASTGAVVQRMDFDEFGNMMSETNGGFQPFGFASGMFDRETGLTRFGARDYDPHTGRWTSKDPIGFAGGDASLYSYCFGNPINLIDPSGLDAITSDPHVLEQLLDLFEQGGSGWRDTERSSFITQNQGTTQCELWPWSAANRTESWPRGKPWPNGVVAVAHTHPTRGADPEPSQGDRANADRVALPFYTVTAKGIYKYDPATQQITEEEDHTWTRRAGQVRKQHQQQGTPTCGCTQLN